MGAAKTCCECKCCSPEDKIGPLVSVTAKCPQPGASPGRGKSPRSPQASDDVARKRSPRALTWDVRKVDKADPDDPEGALPKAFRRPSKSLTNSEMRAKGLHGGTTRSAFGRAAGRKQTAGARSPFDSGSGSPRDEEEHIEIIKDIHEAAINDLRDKALQSLPAVGNSDKCSDAGDDVGLKRKAARIATANRLAEVAMSHVDSDFDGHINVGFELPCKLEMAKEDFDSAFLISCYVGDLQTARMCLEKDALPTVADSDGFKAGYHAALSGNVELLKLIFETDIHKVYNHYFDRTIAPDRMTPLMATIVHGHTEAVKYLLDHHGCQLRLLFDMEVGQKVGADQGLGVQWFKWFELVPEILVPTDVPRRVDLRMKHRILTDAEITTVLEKDRFQKAVNARKEIRELIRRRLGTFRNEDEAVTRRDNKRKALTLLDTKPIAGLKQVPVEGKVVTAGQPSTAPSMSPRGLGRKATAKRGARLETLSAPLAASPEVSPRSREESPRACNQENGTTNENISPGGMDRSPAASPREAAEDDETPAIWICGRCGEHNRQKALTASGIRRCQCCEYKNFLKVSLEETDAGPVEKVDSDDSGELWENVGTEFQEEKDVNKYMGMFRGSILRHLGQHRLRDLLRVVHVEELFNGDVLFKEGARLDHMFCLKNGTMSLKGSSFRGKQKKALIQEVSVIEPLAKEKKPHPGVKVLDQRAFMEHNTSSHKSTATVSSEKATVFRFNKDDVQAFCGGHDLKSLVHDSLSVFVLQIQPVLRLAFDEQELPDVAASLAYTELGLGHVVVSKGQRLSQIVIIFNGRIRVQEGNKTRLITICPDPPTEPLEAGEKWLRVFVVGVRMLLYDVLSPTTVDVDSIIAEAYIMDVKTLDGVFGASGRLIRHIQISSFQIYFTKIVLFKKLKMADPRLKKLAALCEVMPYWAEEDIIVQGTLGDQLFVLCEGTVSITINGKEVASLTSDVDHDKVHFFGELAVLERAPRAATVRVKSNSATAIKVEKKHIDQAFGSLEAVLAEQGMDTSKIIQMTRLKIEGRDHSVDVEDVDVEDVDVGAAAPGITPFSPLTAIVKGTKEKDSKNTRTSQKIAAKGKNALNALKRKLSRKKN